MKKQKVCKIFEDIVRRGIDPGLLELTRGNVFKARVYPIPARGNKKIVVAYEQELQDIGNGYIYNLPLDFPGVVDHFSINVDVLNQAEQPILAGSELTNLRFQRWQNSWKAGLQVRNYRPNQDLSFAVPKYQHVERVFVEEDGGTNYFYVTFTPEVVQKMVKSTSSSFEMKCLQSFLTRYKMERQMNSLTRSDNSSMTVGHSLEH